MLIVLGVVKAIWTVAGPGVEIVRALSVVSGYIAVLVIGAYIFTALKRMYGQSVILTLIKSLVFLFAILETITNIYDFILFGVAYLVT